MNAKPTFAQSVRMKASRLFRSRRPVARPHEDRRRFPRFSFNSPVELHFETPGHLAILKATARNLSRGGMLMKCQTLPQLMAACRVAFRTPDWGPFRGKPHQLVMTEARVRHIDWADSSFGVMFTHPL